MKTKFNLLSFKYFLLSLTVLCTLTVIAPYSQACSVPVFRYALERWKPDPYKGIFIYRGEISKEDQALLDQLRNASANSDSPLNLIVKPVNADTFSKERLEGFFQGAIPKNLPLLSVWHPDQMGKNPPFIKEKLTPSLVNNIVQSPKRQQMAESLIKGASVVWVFIPSGNGKKDENALTLIRQELDRAIKKYEKSPFTILDGAERKKLTYSFPIMTLTRDDQEERIFTETLMRSESDLYEHTDEPMVFPVFGRGRSLGCLFGEYITQKHIEEATHFLSGACSCEIKNLNPGVDLLMGAPWDYVVMNSFIQDDPMPELTGVLPDYDEPKAPATPLEESKINDSQEEPEMPVGTPENSPALLLLYGGTIAAVILFVVIIGAFISRRRKE